MKSMLSNPNNLTKENERRFWCSFDAWRNSQDFIYENIKINYVKYDNWNQGTFYWNIDYENEHQRSIPMNFFEDFKGRVVLNP